jgi:hypothetical protein
MRELGARSESAELMEYGERQQMLPTLMEVTAEKNFTYCVGFILPHASVVMTYAALVVNPLFLHITCYYCLQRMRDYTKI